MEVVISKKFITSLFALSQMAGSIVNGIYSNPSCIKGLGYTQEWMAKAEVMME